MACFNRFIHCLLEITVICAAFGKGSCTFRGGAEQLFRPAGQQNELIIFNGNNAFIQALQNGAQPFVA